MWSFEQNSLGEALAVIVVMVLYCFGLHGSRINTDTQLSEAVLYYYTFPIYMSCVGGAFASRYSSLGIIAFCALFALLYMCRTSGIFEKLPQIPPGPRVAMHVMAFLPIAFCMIGVVFTLDQSHFWLLAGLLISALLIGYAIWRQLRSLELELKNS